MSIMQHTRSEILANRRKWINLLRHPGTKKERHHLENYADPESRCCLGHACHALGIERHADVDNEITRYGSLKDRVSGILPQEAREKLGLFSDVGSGVNIPGYPDYNTLTSLNDQTTYTPQMIGEYLQSVIEGGEYTPFIPLDSYPE